MHHSHHTHSAFERRLIGAMLCAFTGIGAGFTAMLVQHLI